MNVLLSPRAKYLRSIFKTRDWAKIFVFLAFVAVAASVAAGIYAGFLRGFRFFARDAYFGEALTLYALEATMLIVFVFASASAALTGIFTLFNSRENQFLLSTPLSRYRLFSRKFLDIALSSAWSLVLLGVPAILALGAVRPLAVRSLGSSLLSTILLYFGAVALGVAIAFGFVRIFRAVRGTALFLATGTVIIGSAFIVGRILLPRNLAQLFRAEDLSRTYAGIEPLIAHFRILPSHVPALQLFGALPGELFFSAYAYVLAAAAAAFALMYLFARFFYLKLLLRSFEGTFIARKEDRARAFRGFRRFPVLLKTAFGALMEKDVLVFLRSSRETSRAFFLVFMLLLYLILFRRLPLRDVVLPTETLLRILLFNLAAVGYFVTTLALRFVFPLVSLEGKSAWVLFASPLKRAHIFWEKLLVGLLPILAVVAPLATGALAFIGVTGLAVPAFLRFAIWMTITLVTISLAVGAIRPNFKEERDPDKLSTTLPGLFVTALSLGYVALVSFTGFLSMRAYFSSGALLPPVILLAVVPTLALLALFLRLGLRGARTLEV